MDQQRAERKDERPEPPPLPFWKVVLSVVQASFGVQNDATRQRDFGTGSFWPFVAAALIFTVLFVLGLMLVVSLVT